ncbi:MAG TPA: alpha/beta hydrolase [Dehalococcoidia bacterium]|nr:alpha/beta hydrolase [Dehalococcoidia bacterium]
MSADALPVTVDEIVASMRTARVGDVDLAYTLVGEGPLLVLTHGFAGPTPDWPPVILDLAKRCRLLLYDVRGHGRSSAPEDPEAYSMPIFARDLAGLLDVLRIERAHIGGVSMGGMITAQFAVDFSERCRSVLLMDTTAGNDAGEGPAAAWEAQLRQVFAQMEHVVRTYGMADLVERQVAWSREHDPLWKIDPQAEEKARRRLSHMTAAGFAGAARAIRLRPHLLPRLRSVSVPALVLVGEDDWFFPCARQAYEALPNARFVHVRRAGHAVISYRPEVFLDTVVTFIDDVEAGRDVRGERLVD